MLGNSLGILEYYGNTMDNSITLSAWYGLEEVDLMSRCLEAIASNHYIDDQTLQTISGWYTETFRQMSRRFNDVEKVTLEEFEIISQAVAQLAYYPCDNRWELEPFLGVSDLALNWFTYKLRSTRTDWEMHVEEDANAVLCAKAYTVALAMPDTTS
jgi:hypothetical protein